jgi:hypothetical protein
VGIARDFIGAPRAFTIGAIGLILVNSQKREKTMAVYGAIGALIIAACIMATLRSKKAGNNSKISDLNLK